MKLVHGAGINDADYAVAGKNHRTGKQWMCPYYNKWKGMLRRCYSKKYQEKYPTYEGCSVCEDWLIFSNFKSWMESQNWEGKDLDKDLLFEGNKVYSPDKCVFVSSVLNAFVTDSGRARGKYMIGVIFHKRDKNFQSQCNNPITKSHDYLGFFTSELEAHLKWKKRKLELIGELLQHGYIEDIRIYNSLKTKYS